MNRQISYSNYSVSQGSSVNSPWSNQQTTESADVSGHSALSSSSAGWVAQTYASGSSHNPREFNFMDVRSSSPGPHIGTNDERNTEPDGDSGSSSVLATLRLPESQSAREEDVVPQNLDLNIAYEETTDEETGTDSVNQMVDLETYMRTIFVRHGGGHVSSVRSDSTWNSANRSSSFSSLPASGSDSFLQQVNLQNHPGGSSLAQSVPFPAGTERDQIAITSSAYPLRGTPTSFPANYSFQNGVAAVHPSAILQQHVPTGGFSGDVHATATLPRLPQRNIAEEYDERVSGIITRSMSRVPVVGSGGHLGNLPPSRASVNHRRPESRLTYQRARPRPAVQMRGAAGRSSNVRPTVHAQHRGRMARVVEMVNRINSDLHDLLEQLQRGADEHEDMRLDVDNMSYEELLALEERIGDVGTGLSGEAISEGMMKHRYQSMRLGLPVEEEPCCICQEDYIDGEELGTLNCTHTFHFNCIKEWLVQKNVCPICKTTAVAV